MSRFASSRCENVTHEWSWSYHRRTSRGDRFPNDNNCTRTKDKRYSALKDGFGWIQNVQGYSRNPCSLNRERDAAAYALGTPPAWPMSEAPIESRQFIGWWRDAVSDAIMSSAYTGERAIHSSDFSAEKTLSAAWGAWQQMQCLVPYSENKGYASNPRRSLS